MVEMRFSVDCLSLVLRGVRVAVCDVIPCCVLWQVKEVTLVYDSSRRMRGYGDVEFYSKNDLLLAMALNEEVRLHRCLLLSSSGSVVGQGWQSTWLCF